MNERIELKAAIESRRAAEMAQQQATETLARAGEYLATVESELAVLQARNQSEIAQHGRRLVENFRAGVDGAAPIQSQTGSQLIEAERQYSATAAAYAEIERDLSESTAAYKAADIAVTMTAARVLSAESEAIADGIIEAERRAGELREQLRAIVTISSGFVPSQKVRVLSPRAIDALSPKGDSHVPANIHRDNAATWRTRFEALRTDPDYVFQT
ncbi:hypothetical protein LJR034_000827 [Caballeronia sp. LjRoot34]|uniref:hypothetical protein n=1 Tax=Caballeronia sp. LjRoot34 TaxID=3342325 RepID=UPI003ECC5859